MQQVDHHKHRGIHFNKASCGQIMSMKFSLCARRISLLRRLRRILPNPVIRRIYICFIRFILEYACPVWCGGLITKLVNYKNGSATAIMSSFCLWKVFDYNTHMLFYKIKTNLAPAYLTELLPSPSHNSGH